MFEPIDPKELIKLLQWNEQLGCYTRPGFEHIVWREVSDVATWLIFFDVDNMKALNSNGSWDKTSDLIKSCVHLRSTDFVCAVGQVLSGDEFVVAITERTGEFSDPLKLCERIQGNFKAHNASATFAYGRVKSSHLDANLKPLKGIVEAAKRQNRRGTITRLEDTEIPDEVRYQFMNRRLYPSGSASLFSTHARDAQ